MISSGYDHMSCEELREALRAAHARIEPPRERIPLSPVSAYPMPPVGEDPTVPGPAGADADLYREIAALEAAMERNGCEGAR